jgi:hypothetical protein
MVASYYHLPGTSGPIEGEGPDDDLGEGAAVGTSPAGIGTPNATR